MPETREFHLGDVLSITDGRLLSPRGMEGVYDILGFMVGESLFTHQLPRAARECKPELLRQHPQLAAAVSAEVTPPLNGENYRAWLESIAPSVGGLTLSVSPLPAPSAYDTPVADAIEIMGDPTKVIVLED